jgi:uncharacterized protein YybS (DUF2232 family)
VNGSRVGRHQLAGAVELALASVLAIGLFAAGGAVPVLGVTVSLLAPIPFVVLSLRHGRLALFLGLALTAAGLFALLSGPQSLVFLLEFGAAAITLGECLRRDLRTEYSVLVVAGVLLVGGMAVLLVASGSWAHPSRAIGQHLDAMLADAEQLSAQLGLAEGPGALEPARHFRPVLLAAFPGLLFIGSLLTAGGYVVILHGLRRRWASQLGPGPAGGFQWELPEFLVWGFIAAGLCYLSGLPALTVVGLNGLLIFLALYFVQGLCIAAFLFRRFQLPRFLATLSVILLVFQPFFTLLVAGLGLFDIWFAFRRLSLPKPR